VRIIVCIKQVPSIEHLKFDNEARRLIREGVPNQLNTFDRRAITEAVQSRAVDIQAAREDVVRADAPKSNIADHGRRQTSPPYGRWYFDAPCSPIELGKARRRQSSGQDSSYRSDRRIEMSHSRFDARADDVATPAGDQTAVGQTAFVGKR